MSEQEQKIVSLIRANLRAPEIAARVGCSVNRVYVVATQHRISTKTGKPLDIENKDARIVQLYEQGLSAPLIMERLGVTRGAVRMAIARRNAARQEMKHASD